MTLSLRQSTAFILGFSFAFLPSYGPFISLLLLLSSRSLPFRSAGLWASAALLLALPLLLNSSWQFALALVQVLAPWLVYVAFSQLPQLQLSFIRPQAVALGLISGLGAVIALGFLNISQIDIAYRTLSQAITWLEHPALYGHTVLTLGALIALLSRSERMRIASLSLCAIGVLISGSGEAAIAWILIVLLSSFFQKRRWSLRLAELSFVVLMLLMTAGLGSRLGWGNVGFLVDVLPGAASTNLVRGSELPTGDWWDSRWVSYDSSAVSLNGQTLTAYHVQKNGSEQWYRLQQVIPLEAHTPYTISLWIKKQENARPGIQGWGQIDGTSNFVLTGALYNQSWRTFVSDHGAILDAGIAASEGDWQRAYITFEYRGDNPRIFWYVGMAPDQRPVAGTAASFAGFQIEQSQYLSDYSPGTATRGLSLGVARLPFWDAAWEGILQKPWLGWGADSFPSFYETTANRSSQLQAVPAHVHNLYLQTLFERGLLGFLGLLLFIAALSARAIRQKDSLLLTVLAAVLLMNVFDISLFYGAVLYPLAAIAGWRSATYSQSESNSAAKQFFVRVVLATVDFAMTYLLLLVSVWLYSSLVQQSLNISAGLSYALLLWPLLSWREGLYPGYGLSSPQELRKQVSAAFHAGIILVAGSVVFSELVIPNAVLLLLVMSSMIVLPVGRYLSKQLLIQLNLWGRPVIILGADAVGRRIAKALNRHPNSGLIPVAFFDSEPSRQLETIHGLPVVADLAAAEDFAQSQGINHVIISPTALQQSSLPKLHQQRTFRTVQYLPELPGIPSEDVTASNLGGLLALEVRLGLHSRLNRFFKRSMDIIGSSLLLVLLAPLLGVIYLFIRLDSAGPALYRSGRIGQFGRSFGCLKFRSMYADADEKLSSLLQDNPALKEEYERYHKLEHDPRISRIGKVLRKFSLDELPQLWNVLTGQMSLIGPRPYLIDEYQKMNGARDTILAAKPGMTGYWQVSGRSNTTFAERLEMEAYYVRNWSIWWDIIILMQTLPAALKADGAK